MSETKKKPIIERCPQCGNITKNCLNLNELIENFKTESVIEFYSVLDYRGYGGEANEAKAKVAHGFEKMFASSKQFKCKKCGKSWESSAYYTNAVGLLYYNEEQLRDYEKAFKYFKIAAEQGNAAAIYNLGVCYKNGFGCQQDTEMAIKYFKEADEMGFKEAAKILKGID